MRDKPAQCYASACPLAVTCRNCGHHESAHTTTFGGPGTKTVIDSCAETTDGQACACDRFESLGRGFVLGTGDPAKAKYAFVLEAPGREELSFKLQAVPGRSFFSDEATVQREIQTRQRDYPDVPLEFLKRGAPVVGQNGAALFGWILPKAGIKRDETVFLDNTLRCLAPNGPKGPYPTGEVKKGAERCCRQWDRLDKYRPDTVVFGLHPAGILREITPLPLAVKDAERVRDFTAAGRRVLALLGGKAAQAFARYGSNISKWRGHYFSLAADWTQTYKQLFDYVAKKSGTRKKKVNTEETDIWGVPASVTERAREKATRPAELSPVACKSFKRYQGKRAPKCGCEPCWIKFESAAEKQWVDQS